MEIQGFFTLKIEHTFFLKLILKVVSFFFSFLQVRGCKQLTTKTCMKRR